MRVTSVRLVVGLAVLGAAVGWSLIGLLRGRLIAVPSLPWSAPAGLVVFAVLLFGGGWYMYDRVHRNSRGVDLVVAVRLLLLGKASALVGGLVAGVYAGFGLDRVVRMGRSLLEDQALLAFVTAGAAALVTGGALVLERACRVPDGSDEHGSSNEVGPYDDPSH